MGPSSYLLSLFSLRNVLFLAELSGRKIAQVRDTVNPECPQGQSSHSEVIWATRQGPRPAVGGSGQPCLCVCLSGVYAPAHALGGRPACLHKQPESHTVKKPACCSRHAAAGCGLGASSSPRMPLLLSALLAEQFVVSTLAAGGGICGEAGWGVVCQAGLLESPLGARSLPRPSPC